MTGRVVLEVPAKPEFLLLEWYRAFAGQADVERDTEQVVVAVARALRGKAELVTPEGRPR